MSYSEERDWNNFYKIKNRYSSDIDPGTYIIEFNNLSELEQNAAIMNPGHVDEAKWEAAKKAAAESGHAEKWPLVMYIYEKMKGEK